MRRVARQPLICLPIAAALILSACGASLGRVPDKSLTSPSPTSTPAPTPRTMSVDGAAALIRLTVTQSRPVLIPKTIPAGFTGEVTVSPDDFRVTYRSADGLRNIFFELGVAQPGPPQPDGSQSYPRFRTGNPIYPPMYQIDTRSTPTARRFIEWGEPGTASPVLQDKPKYGVPYFLSTEGLTETEFWMVANSVGSAG